MLDYFKNIWISAATVFEGLTITASHLLRKPITIQYPDRTKLPVKEMLPERTRGLLDVDLSICTACTLCQNACPIGCISIDIEKRTPPESQTSKVPLRFIRGFDIDIALCMFCGFCTEVCPTGAIHFTREFEYATPNVAELIFHFVKGAPVAPYKPIKGA